MSSYSKLSDLELEPWIDGTNAQIGSSAYHAAKLEYDKRVDERKFEKQRKDVRDLIEAINGLAEDWKTKALWLIIVALVVGVLINVLSELILKYII